MFNNLKKLTVALSAISLLVSCNGGDAPPNGAAGILEQSAAAAAMGIVATEVPNMLKVPSGTNLTTDFGISLPMGYEDPSALALAPLMASPYDDCITVETSPYKKITMNCLSVVDGVKSYDFVGTIEIIENDTVSDSYHYVFDFRWFQYEADGTGEGGKFKGTFKHSVSGTTRTVVSELSKTWLDNRIGGHCIGNLCDADYTVKSNWSVAIDTGTNSMDFSGFSSIKGRSNFNAGGWDGSINTSFSIVGSSLVFNLGGGITSGTLKFTDGAGNEIAITWAGGMVLSTTYNGAGI